MIIGIAMFAVFFVSQTRMEKIDATIQPQTWFIKNFRTWPSHLASSALPPNFFADADVCLLS